MGEKVCRVVTSAADTPLISSRNFRPLAIPSSAPPLRNIAARVILIASRHARVYLLLTALA